MLKIVVTCLGKKNGHKLSGIYLVAIYYLCLLHTLTLAKHMQNLKGGKNLQISTFGSVCPGGDLSGSTSRNPMHSTAPKTANNPINRAIRNSINSEDPLRPILENTLQSKDFMTACFMVALATRLARKIVVLLTT